MKAQTICTMMLLMALASPGIPGTDSTAGDPAKAARTAREKAAYGVCAACHGQDGRALPTQPPMAPSLVGSKLVLAASEVPITIVLKGIQKADSRFLGVMAPLGSVMTDAQIADALSYIRGNWGHQASSVTANDVRSVREKYKEISASLPRRAYERKAEELVKKASPTPPPADASRHP